MITSFIKTYIFNLNDIEDKQYWEDLLIRLNKSNADYLSTIVGNTAIIEIREKWTKEAVF